MVDARTFWIGAFMTLWVVMFFCVSAYELFKTRPVVLESAASAGQPRAATRSLKNVGGKDAADFSLVRVSRGRGASGTRGSG